MVWESAQAKGHIEQAICLWLWCFKVHLTDISQAVGENTFFLIYMFKCNIRVLILRLTHLSPPHNRRVYDFHFQVWRDGAKCVVTSFRISYDLRPNVQYCQLMQSEHHLSFSRKWSKNYQHFKCVSHLPPSIQAYLSLPLPRHATLPHSPQCACLTLIFLSLKSSLWPVSLSSSQSILLSWLIVPVL